MRLAVVATLMGLVGVGCGPGRADAPAQLWTLFDMVDSAATDKSFAAFPAKDFTQAGAMTVFPSFSEGASAAYVVTEVWDHHPTPWIQPVYLLVTSIDPLVRLPGQKTIFPVGVGSTFYTPYWRAKLVLVPSDLAPDSVRDAAALLNARYPVISGPLVTCPIGPGTVDIARPGPGAVPVRPYTQEAVRAPTQAVAWVDGREVDYLDLGAGGYADDGSARPVEVPMYFFVSLSNDGSIRSLPLPAVSGPHALRHSYVRRYEVLLDSSVRVFVPADQPLLRAQVESAGLSAPATVLPSTSRLAAEYTLRVATDARCFASVDFPTGCTWLDSEAAIKALPDFKVLRTETTLAATTVRAQGATR